VSLPAAKTEFKTIASKVIQHPAVTIERIRPRRRVIELPVQTRLSGAAVPSRAATPNRTVRMAWRGVSECRAKPHDCDNVRSLKGRGNKTRSLSLMYALRINSGTTKQKDRPKAVSWAENFSEQPDAIDLGNLGRGA
jgi:hypothetical protein